MRVRELSEQQRGELAKLSEQHYRLGEAGLRSFSGADQADSEYWFGQARVYGAVLSGVPLEDALAGEDARWRAYAAEQQAKVSAAPKIRRGPSEGHSSIAHRWVSAEKFSGAFTHLRFMIRRILES
jgi:hypothetical protein